MTDDDVPSETALLSDEELQKQFPSKDRGILSISDMMLKIMDEHSPGFAKRMKEKEALKKRRG